MSANKHKPHVLVIPEDRADEQIANGFLLHDRVRNLTVERPAGGWPCVLDRFTMESIPYLRKYDNGFVILLVDFDNKYEERRKRFAEAVPPDLKNRVFVVGAKENPEALKKVLSKSFEDIGKTLAEDCHKGVDGTWSHDHMTHNAPDRQGLIQSVRSILFV